MALVTRQGAGALLTQAQGDTNWDTLNGINESVTGTSHTIDHTDENKTIEYSNVSPIAVTLTAISTLDGNNDSQISDFLVVLKNIGAGLVTVTCGGSDTMEDGATSFTIPQYSTATIQTDSTGGKWNYITRSLGGLEGKSFASTDDVIDNFPAGTAMVFYQAAAPTGWTGSDALASHAIEIVTETSANGGSTGGSVDFSTIYGRTATDSHVLTIAEMPAHTHTYTTYLSGGSTLDTGSGRTQGSEDSGSAGSGDGHTHNIDLQVKYAQMIIATKD